jgi:hypothetical protein
MKIIHWCSDTFRRRSKRERLVVVGGIVVTVTTLLAVYVVQPFARHWSDREAEIVLRAEQLGRLRALADQEQAFQVAVVDLRRERDRGRRRLLEGDTPAVGASSLVLLLNRYADESQVLIERVDVAGEVAAANDSLVSIPARVTARGDVYGLVDLLFYVQYGEKLLVIDDLRVTAVRTVGDRSREMTWTIGLHGYYTPRVSS